MMRFFCVAFVVLIAGCSGSRNRDLVIEPQASVDGQRLVSEGFPIGTIQFDSTLTYVGSETFVLYGIARCEIHLFADADENRQVERLYWMQYEGYLPSLMPRKYNYSDEPYRTEIGGKTFFDGVNSYDVATSRPDWRQDSDIEHVFQLLDREGYQFNTEVMRIRLVHLDEKRKNELMIMYVEALQPHGLSITDLEDAEGNPTAESTNIYEQLRNRALSGMDASFN